MTARAPQSSVPPPYLFCIKDTLNVCFLSGTFLHAGDNVALFKGVSKNSAEYFPIKWSELLSQVLLLKKKKEKEA